MSGRRLVEAVVFDWGGTLTPWHEVDLPQQWRVYAREVHGVPVDDPDMPVEDLAEADGLAARILEAEGGLPVDDLPRSPGGRIDRAAADAQFETYRIEAEAAPDDWRARYRLSLAYDASGDRTRAREAAREAVRLHRAG